MCPIDENENRETVGNAAAHAMTLDEAIAHAEDVAGNCDTSCKRDHRQLADWLKELREMRGKPVGNAAAMRDALLVIRDALSDRERDGLTEPRDILERRIVDAALAAPPRNCDVGTAEEQWRRRVAYCRNHSCKICPLSESEHGGVSCDITWSQMPYDEGGCDA